MPWYRTNRMQRRDSCHQQHHHPEQPRPQWLAPSETMPAHAIDHFGSDAAPRSHERATVVADRARTARVALEVAVRTEQSPLRHDSMIGEKRRSQQRFPVSRTGSLALALAGAAAACSSGGREAPNLPPTIVTAAFVGASGTPAAGDELLLVFSEDVTLSGAALTDADVALSGNSTLGTVTAAAVQVAPRTIAVTLGAGVSFTPGVTQVALSLVNDAVRDQSGLLGKGGTAVTIGDSDGASPTIGNLTIADVDGLLNGAGPAGGTLQVPPNGWTIDLAFTDNVGIDVSRTQVTASVAVSTSAGTQVAGTNLFPFLTTAASTLTSASLAVPSTTAFPGGPFTLTCVVIDLSGLASAPSSFAATCRAFADDLRPFETNVNTQQVWFLDFSRDVESFTTSTITGGVSVDVVNGANGRSDFEDLLLILGLTSATPIANVQGSSNSNDVAIAAFETALVTNLASLYSGTNVAFTLTQPGAAFGSNSSVPYSSFGYSQISIAGASSQAGVLGVAIFDPSNATQNDDTRTDFSGVRLGVFLHTIADAGMGPPGSSAFRLTFAPLAPALGGTAIGDDPLDGQRLLGTQSDSRRNQIDAAIQDFGRFVAVVTAHECGHSMGLVRNGAMPVGLYGNDPVNFPGSQDGHIRTAALFPTGATNVMSPALSYSTAIHAATAFNSLNLAYLREQVFYGN